MLMPKRVKYRKQFRGSMAGTPTIKQKGVIADVNAQESEIS